MKQIKGLHAIKRKVKEKPDKKREKFAHNKNKRNKRD